MASSPYQGSCFAKQRVAVSFKLEGSLVLFPDLVSGFVTLLAGFVSVGIRALRSSGLPVLSCFPCLSSFFIESSILVAGFSVLFSL